MDVHTQLQARTMRHRLCRQCKRRFLDLDVFGHFAQSLDGVTTPNVKNRTLRNLGHSFEAAKGRRGLKEPLRRRPAACQV
jgi:hypothetical protein